MGLLEMLFPEHLRGGRRAPLLDETAILRSLTEELGLKELEAETYLRALKVGSIAEDGDAQTVRSLASRGMLIRSSDEKVYLPVHPRLALSNLFRAYQDRMTIQMREKRKMVDRLTLELVHLHDKREAGKKAAPEVGDR
jgi:hypothetical protein